MDITLKELSTNDYELACELIHFVDADADFLFDLRRRKETNFHVVFADHHPVGIVQLKLGRKAFLYLFLDPAYRQKGIGTKALELCEKIILADRVEQVITTYRANHIPSKAFASRFGYARTFSSTYMRYTGSPFPIPTQVENQIRPYCDEDYDAAHEMYAKAFHEMRVNVGDFPNSVIEQPSDHMRTYWANTANERFVYLLDDTIVGYAHIEGEEISSVSVRHQYQGQGIGRNFVRYLSNTLLESGNDAVSLYCVVGNPARKLYDSLGFHEVYSVEYATKLMNPDLSL